jgi:hypothetical protein
MRKHYKRKRHSCMICKPHKTGHVNRWKDKEQMLLREADYDMRQEKFKAFCRTTTSVGYCPISANLSNCLLN